MQDAARVSRALNGLPAAATAFERGEVSWTQARLLAGVATRDTERTWLARASERTTRALEAPDVHMRAHTGWETIDAEITVLGPASVMGLLRTAIAARTLAPEPGWRALERLLAHVDNEWTAQPLHRDPVFARDGWRCAVPACSGRRNLQDHHVLFRSRGGSNRRDNRLTVCAWHHLRALHARTVRAWGKAPGAIRWELGVRANGPPLASLVGDRYLSSS